jgi:hypothetical protein
MIGTLLHEKITGNPEIAAIIASRMYPVALPQTPTVPAVVYFFDNATSTLSNSGPSGLGSATLRVDSWADNFDEDKTLYSIQQTYLIHYSETQ